MERVQADGRLGCLGPHRGMDPLSPVGRHVGDAGGPFGAEGVEERLHRRLATARRRPDQPAGVVVDHHGQVAVPLAVGDLVDPDPSHPLQQVPRADRSGHDSLDDRGHRPPRRTQQLCCRRPRGVRRQPCGGVFERIGEPRRRPRPRDRSDDDTVTATVDPRGVRLELHHRRAHIERPPPTPTWSYPPARRPHARSDRRADPPSPTGHQRRRRPSPQRTRTGPGTSGGCPRRAGHPATAAVDQDARRSTFGPGRAGRVDVPGAGGRRLPGALGDH